MRSTLRHLICTLTRGVRHPLLALTVAVICTLQASAQTAVTKEYQVKAVLLFRLTQFVEWPSDRFASPESPIVIGVLGSNPFGDALKIAVRGETANGRPIETIQIQSTEEAKACHVVFVSASEQSRVKEVTAALSRFDILTVSDTENFVDRHGGIVQFVMSENRVNLRIHVERARRAGLTLNSRLLRMAEIVTGD